MVYIYIFIYMYLYMVHFAATSQVTSMIYTFWFKSPKRCHGSFVTKWKIASRFQMILPHIPWDDAPNFPKPPHKLLVKHPRRTHLSGWPCGWDLRRFVRNRCLRSKRSGRSHPTIADIDRTSWIAIGGDDVLTCRDMLVPYHPWDWYIYLHLP